ncbi:MAG: hypothetical protein E4G92_03340 [Bacteroidia bacterium]|nr:MAG: hypothetical protein E4G92_03340 [Bacteroidia bacterium]
MVTGAAMAIRTVSFFDPSTMAISGTSGLLSLNKPIYMVDAISMIITAAAAGIHTRIGFLSLRARRLSRSCISSAASSLLRRPSPSDASSSKASFGIINLLSSSLFILNPNF